MHADDLQVLVTERRSALRALAASRRAPEATRRARVGFWLIRAGLRLVPTQERHAPLATAR